MPQVFPAVNVLRFQDTHTKGKGQCSRSNATYEQMPQVFPAVSAWWYQETHKKGKMMQSKHTWGV